MIKLKRAYEKPAKNDEKRILVDRLWPRGISKEKARIDKWMKEIAPSPQLRKWFAHDITRWKEFRRMYEKELQKRGELLEELIALAKEGNLTLVYAARDGKHSNAMVLKEMLESLSLSRTKDYGNSVNISCQ